MDGRTFDGMTGLAIDVIIGSSMTSVFKAGSVSGMMRDGLLVGAIDVGGGMSSFAFSSFST